MAAVRLRLSTMMFLQYFVWGAWFVTMGQIYVDQRAPVQVRAAAQGLLAFITHGVGLFIGAALSGRIVEHYTLDVGHDWISIWLVPAVAALAIMIVFAFLFRPGPDVKAEPAPQLAEAPAPVIAEGGVQP